MSSSPEVKTRHGVGSKSLTLVFVLLALVILAGVTYSINSIQNINNNKVEPYLAIVNNNLGVNPKLLKIISYIQDYQAAPSNANYRKLIKGYRVMRASVLNDLDSQSTKNLHEHYGDLEKLAKIVDALQSFEGKFDKLSENEHEANLKLLKTYRKQLGRLYRTWNSYSRRAIQKVQQAHADTWAGWNHQLKIQLYFLLLIAITSVAATGLMYYLYRKQLLTRKALESRTQELNEARLLAEESTRAKSRFLANMSHEIRTPLNGIIGLSRLVYSKEQSKELRSYLENIVLSGNSLLQIINDVLDISKIEANKMSLDEQDFVLEDVIKPLSVSMGFAAKSKDISFLLFTPPSLSICLKGDATKFTQVLNNLCSNAIKFTQEGGVTVSIQVQDKDSEVTLSVSVRDTGIGLTPEQQKLIFKEFVQADDSTTRKFGGTGLGLSISRNFVEMMGGELTVESEPDIGSNFCFSLSFPKVSHGVAEDRWAFKELDREILERFNLKVVGATSYDIQQIESDLKRCNLFDVNRSFTHVLYAGSNDSVESKEALVQLLETNELPSIVFASNNISAEIESTVENSKVFGASYATNVLVEYLLENAEQGPSLVEDASPECMLEGKNILVAEDNQVNQIVAQACLEQLGASVVLVGNGIECIEALKTSVYDLILMDIQMPEMDGLEATRHILSHDLAHGAPIVALTANVFKEDIDAYIAAGMSAHLPKPFDSDALCELISKLTD